MEGFKVIRAVSPKNISDSWRAVTCNATENCWWCCRNLGSTRLNTDTIRHPHHPHKISQAFFPLADWWLISSLQKWKPCTWQTQTRHYRPTHRPSFDSPGLPELHLKQQKCQSEWWGKTHCGCDWKKASRNWLTVIWTASPPSIFPLRA